jgi:hypothetical protein
VRSSRTVQFSQLSDAELSGGLVVEIAGGIVLAIFALIFVLANFGRIVVVLSAILLLMIASLSTIFIFALPSDARNAILIVILAIAALSVFAYWTHVDKRFYLSEESDQRRRVKRLKSGDRVSVTDRTGAEHGTIVEVDRNGETFGVRWDSDGHANTLWYFDIDLLDKN